MRVLLLGASRHVGYSVALRLLAQGHTCTLLLRHPEVLESDEAISSYIKDGKAIIVPGDALVEADVQRAWNAARGDEKVDVVYFGIGGEPSFSWRKVGFVISPTDLTTRSMSILLSVIQSSTTPSTRPRLVSITSNGLDSQSRTTLPLTLRILYGWFLRAPFADKAEQERILKHAAGWDDAEDGWLGSNNVVIIRPSMLTDDECLADKKPGAYRTGPELKNPWSISRGDVAHFVVEKVLDRWERWQGKTWVVSY
ncbi:hypothetical protein FRC08_004147 [Ceratobasidium sp. 394]|nr:hypothetical protein FRC08_004147 [Ceratobasidium sp. 394]